MKFKVNVNDLKQVLAVAKETAGNGKQVLDGIRIEANAKGRVRISTNDGSYATDVSLDATVEKEGEIIVKAHLLQQYISRLFVTEATFSLNDKGNLNVKTSKGQQTFNALPETEFRGISVDNPSSVTDLSGKTFKQMINGVAFATGNDKNVPITEGVNVVSNGRMIHMAATDHARIAYMRKKIAMPPINITVGKKVLVQASRIVADTDKVQLLTFDTVQQFGIRVGDCTWITPLYSGTFPNVERLVTKGIERDTIAIFDKEEMISMLERAIPLCEDVAFISITSSKIHIKGSNQFSTFNEFMFAKTDGDPVEVRFKIKDAMSVLKGLQADTIEIGVESGKPIVLQPSTSLKQVCVLAGMN